MQLCCCHLTIELVVEHWCHCSLISLYSWIIEEDIFYGVRDRWITLSSCETWEALWAERSAHHWPASFLSCVRYNTGVLRGDRVALAQTQQLVVRHKQPADRQLHWLSGFVTRSFLTWTQQIYCNSHRTSYSGTDQVCEEHWDVELDSLWHRVNRLAVATGRIGPLCP